MSLIDGYLRYLAERGFSPSTLATRESALRIFGSWLGKNLKDATTKDIEAHLLYLKPKFKPRSLANRYHTLRKFYDWCFKEKKIIQDPTFLVESPARPTKELPSDVPDEKQMERLLNAPDLSTNIGIRDKAVLELLYSSALRAMEVRALTLKDIDLNQRIVYIQEGKGKKGRAVPFGEKAKEAIQTYLEKVRFKPPKNQKQEELFLTNYGTPLKRHALFSIVKRYRKKLGFKTLRPHLLRHAAALHMLRNGAPITMVQAFLGHKSLQATQIYTRLYPQDLKKAHQKFNPRDRMEGVK